MAESGIILTGRCGILYSVCRLFPASSVAVILFDGTFENRIRKASRLCIVLCQLQLIAWRNCHMEYDCTAWLEGQKSARRWQMKKRPTPGGFNTLSAIWNRSGKERVYALSKSGGRRQAKQATWHIDNGGACYVASTLYCVRVTKTSDRITITRVIWPGWRNMWNLL